MGRSSLLFITLSVSLSSLWSLVQTSQSVHSSASIQTTGSTGRSNNTTHRLSRETILYSESSASMEGSGHTVDTISQKIINWTAFTKEPEQADNENYSGFGSTFDTTLEFIPVHFEALDQGTDKAHTSSTGQAHSSVHIISEETLFGSSHLTTEAQSKESHATIANYGFVTGGDNPDLPVQTQVFMTNQNRSGPGGPCVLGLSPCVVLTNFNGTNLLWDDMKRTLAFAWELHVFGSASLFILMAVLAVLGLAGASTLPSPLCGALTLSNSLLVLSATLRAVVLLLDPYGSRQILSRAALAALHNAPLQLLLWAQVALAVVTLTWLKLFIFPLQLQRPLVVAGLASTHCTLLLAVDLCSPILSPPLPFLLQTLSLCWGLPLCMGVLTKSLCHLHLSLSSSVPQWVPSHRIKKHAMQVTALCAFFGVLCCSLQMYSLLWLYGLLGNWRHFGWGWWLSQFLARILEVAWGFSLFVLGSWIYLSPSRGHSRGDHWQGRGEVSKGAKEASIWGRVLSKPDTKWIDLMPKTWEMYNLSTAGISNNIKCPYDDQSSTILIEFKPNLNSADPQAAVMWQNAGERECVLSLIEFDMRPPSPINLRHSIDNALHHGQLVAGPLFTPPPPSWSHTMDQEATNGETFSSAYVGYGWMSGDTESISGSMDYFQAKEPQSPNATTDHDNTESPASQHQGEEFDSLTAVTHQHDWSEDDVTDL